MSFQELTNNELKALLTKNSLPAYGAKDELVKRLVDNGVSFQEKEEEVTQVEPTKAEEPKVRASSHDAILSKVNAIFAGRAKAEHSGGMLVFTGGAEPRVEVTPHQPDAVIINFARQYVQPKHVVKKMFEQQ
jgi:hypothetical protein